MELKCPQVRLEYLQTLISFVVLKIMWEKKSINRWNTTFVQAQCHGTGVVYLYTYIYVIRRTHYLVSRSGLLTLQFRLNNYQMVIISCLIRNTCCAAKQTTRRDTIYIDTIKSILGEYPYCLLLNLFLLKSWMIHLYMVHIEKSKPLDRITILDWTIANFVHLGIAENKFQQDSRFPSTRTNILLVIEIANALLLE